MRLRRSMTLGSRRSDIPPRGRSLRTSCAPVARLDFWKNEVLKFTSCEVQKSRRPATERHNAATPKSSIANGEMQAEMHAGRHASMRSCVTKCQRRGGVAFHRGLSRFGGMTGCHYFLTAFSPKSSEVTGAQDVRRERARGGTPPRLAAESRLPAEPAR